MEDYTERAIFAIFAMHVMRAILAEHDLLE